MDRRRDPAATEPNKNVNINKHVYKGKRYAYTNHLQPSILFNYINTQHNGFYENSTRTKIIALHPEKNI